MGPSSSPLVEHCADKFSILIASQGVRLRVSHRIAFIRGGVTFLDSVTAPQDYHYTNKSTGLKPTLQRKSCIPLGGSVAFPYSDVAATCSTYGTSLEEVFARNREKMCVKRELAARTLAMSG